MPPTTNNYHSEVNIEHRQNLPSNSAGQRVHSVDPKESVGKSKQVCEENANEDKFVENKGEREEKFDIDGDVSQERTSKNIAIAATRGIHFHVPPGIKCRVGSYLQKSRAAYLLLCLRKPGPKNVNLNFPKSRAKRKGANVNIDGIKKTNGKGTDAGEQTKPRYRLFQTVPGRPTLNVDWVQRTIKGDSFIRRRPSSGKNERRSTIVMRTPSAEFKPWEGILAPGKYKLHEIIDFPDIEKPTLLLQVECSRCIPRHAKFRLGKDSWRSSENQTSGILKLSQQEVQYKVIPVETATDILLQFYHCCLVGKDTPGVVELHEEHVIQDFEYSKDYFKKYVGIKGAGIEKHNFAHIDCPLSSLDKSGVFLLGKQDREGDEDYLYLTAFRIPQHHALYVPAGTLHSNDYLQGVWRTMLSWTSSEPIDHVNIICAGEEKKAAFNIDGVNVYT